MSNIESPIPLSDIESILAWVDSFKLTRPTKKINRDFSDAVLLAEILSVHYPKLVEMHNYPPRNSHSLKLNNWMTLNRKVLKKLKLNLCCNTMEQLANCANGVIERVLIMVRDKIRRDEEANKSMRDTEQNMSSGGSYYEACGDDENILVVPVKTRVNGVLETVQQKVVSYDSYVALKEELKDAKDSTDVLKQKVEHLDSLLKLKDERIDELQNQLDRKQSRRKEAEALQNSLQVPFDTVPSPVVPNLSENAPIVNVTKIPSSKSVEVNKVKEESKIPIKLDSNIKTDSNIMKVLVTSSKPSITEVSTKYFEENLLVENPKPSQNNYIVKNIEENRYGNQIIPDYTEVTQILDVNYENINVDRIRSDVFKEVEIIDDKVDLEDFKDSEGVTTIDETIQREIKNIIEPMEFKHHMKY